MYSSSSGNLYKLKCGGDSKSDNRFSSGSKNSCISSSNTLNISSSKNMAAHLRKKSIKEGMVKHSFSGCEGEGIKYHRKKANNYKNNNNNGMNSGNYHGASKYISTLPPSSYNYQPLDATNPQYHQQHYHQ